MAYYKVQFALKQHHGWAIDELDGLIPWERDIYLAQLQNYLKEKEEEMRRNNG